MLFAKIAYMDGYAGVHNIYKQPKKMRCQLLNSAFFSNFSILYNHGEARSGCYRIRSSSCFCLLVYDVPTKKN